jgi:hypothetical protein
MSRSNPNVNAPNPAVRWFEWNGEHGVVRYYDKDAKQNIDVPLPFTLLVLDELASVRGWHDASESGIYSNEVRDTTRDVMIVKSFKGGTLAEGLYKGIKDRINAVGGQFVANCYVAVKLESGLSLCSMRFKGSALGAWMEFRKANRSALYSKAVRITGYTEGKKGRITFRVPAFELKDVSDETNDAAVRLDRELQAYLEGYLQRKTSDQAADAPEPGSDVSDTDAGQRSHGEPLTDDDIPFSWLLPLALPALAAAGLMLS